VIPMELFSLYSDIQRTPSGEIFLASVFSGSMDIVRFPNLQGENMTLEYGAIDGIGFTNSMGNYFHAYGSKPLWLEGPENLCMGESATVSVYGCPNGEIQWSADPSVVLTPSVDFETEVTFTQPGTYTIQAAILNDCGYLFGDITISVTDAMVPDLGPDVNVCETEPLVLDPGSGFESYLWNNGTTNATLSIESPGTYSVQTTDSLGCTAADTVVVQNLISGTINLGADFNLCDSLVVLLDAGAGFGSYQWQDGSTGQYYTVYEPGTYSVIASEPCVVFDEIQVLACGDTIEVPGNDPWFEVYPNPSIGYFIVHLNQSLDDVDMRVYDDIGRLVKDYKLSGGGNFIIDASSWAAAVYYLKVSGSGLNEVRRVVVY
jgi:Secretion system C-terminal sorting domain